MVKAKLNLREFNAAIRAYAKESKSKDFPAVLNHAGQKVATRAIRETKAAKNVWPLRVTDNPARTTKKGNFTKRAKDAQRLYYGLAKKRGLSGDAARRWAVNEWSKRRKGKGEAKAGWVNPALAMGAKLRLRPYGGGSASKSKGRKATGSTLRAYLANMAEAAGKRGSGGTAPLQRAINYAARDMMKYARRKMQERARKYSGR